MMPQAGLLEAINPPLGIREAGEEGLETTGGNVVFQTIPDLMDPTDQQRRHLLELSGVLSFWDDPQEDIYTLEDGEPL